MCCWDTKSVFSVFNMAASVYVRVSGPALSFLLYENVKSPSDQEGFLLGEIESHITDTISDSQMRGEKSETLISVNSLMPIPDGLTFYNGIGKLDHEKFKHFLKEKEKVVGWYSFRRNSVLNPHLRDKLLHKELCSSLSHISSEHFTMCLLNTSISAPGSTHMFNHKFVRYRHRMFEPLPMQIHNLGEAPQSEYKLVPSTACLSDSFNSIISSLRAGHEMSSDASLVCNIQRALQEHLWNLVKDVQESEKQIAELQKEVNLIRLQTQPLPNELLLPQILKADVPLAVNSSTTTTSIDTPAKAEIPSCVPSKINKKVNNNSSEPNHLEMPLPKEHASVEQKSSTDAFDFVTEMKIQMSQPQMSPESCSVGSKRLGERGRGSARGSGRGIRKSLNTDGIPNNQQSIKANSPNRNSLNSKPHAGYAQAVKRPGVTGETASPINKTSNSELQKH